MITPLYALSRSMTLLWYNDGPAAMTNAVCPSIRGVSRSVRMLLPAAIAEAFTRALAKHLSFTSDKVRTPRSWEMRRPRAPAASGAIISDPGPAASRPPTSTTLPSPPVAPGSIAFPA